MTTWLYDGSFDGFLSAVFDLYWQKRTDVMIRKEQDHVRGLFENVIFTPTVVANADRVWAGLTKKLSEASLQQLFCCYLSELPGEEDNMVGFIRYVFANEQDVTSDFGNRYVLHVSQVSRKVLREKHRMEAFVRFQLTKDNIYYSLVSPDYNVLPLIARHFKDRYADQYWLIYDERRRFGIYYNLGHVETIRLHFNADYDPYYHSTGNVWAPEEELYQRLWNTYFKEVDIASRRNPRLQLQHMPRRYWKYLTEMRAG
ncbi:TIGR03915 family putative DNA repair protein [Chitinophaga sp. S165]|uniref:TIGR03915 family putative DNA repair protein n=1 Tax=Chitinophaga sp. S165 TaxID=2135462 RepID=UPI000D710F9A|nr:TIGR03915 family putative DNA repair protein [Chitinophaga sp. S165]PWV55966.1 putative DNA metabolism protein [Chitinophaga sp. S165]